MGRWVFSGIAVAGSVLVGMLTAPVGVAEPTDPAAQPIVETAAPASAPTPPEGVSHLPSPDHLPPGTTQAPPEPRSLGYLRDIWQAVRSQDVTVAQAAMLLITHRPGDGQVQSDVPAPLPVPDGAAPETP